MKQFAQWERQATAHKSRGGAWWKAKDGENIIRIFGFQHTITDGDFALGRVGRGPDEPKTGDDTTQFFLAYRHHFLRGGPITCGTIKKLDGRYAGNCETCDEARELKDSPVDADKAAYSRMKAKVRYAMTILPAGEAETKVWECGQTIIDFLIESLKMMKTMPFGAEGRDLCVRYNPKAPPVNMYTCMWMDREDSDDLSSVDAKVPDLWLLPKYVPDAFSAYLQAAAPPEPAATPQPADEEEVASPPPSPKKARKRKKKAASPGTGDVVNFTHGDVLVGGTVVSEHPSEPECYLVQGELEGELLEFEVYLTDIV